MLVSLKNGDITLEDISGIVRIIYSAAAEGMAEIWLSHNGRSLPALAVLVNGEYGCVNYFGRNDGDIMLSKGCGTEEVLFEAGGIEWSAPADAVIPLDDVLMCVKEFCGNEKLPRCIEWQDGV